MARILYANGCSWTAGNGLSRDPGLARHPIGPYDLELGKLFAWPAMLGRKLSCDVINQSQGGGSNKRILRVTTDFIMNCDPKIYPDLLVVIGWTSIERDEVYINTEPAPAGILNPNGYSDWYRMNARQKFSQSHPYFPMDIRKELNTYQRIYLTYIYNRIENLNAYFQQVYLLSNLLNNLGIKYLFFNGVLTEFNRTPEEDLEFEKRLDRIRQPNIITDTTFTDFCKKNKLPLSPCYHPMVQGHSSWANFLFDRLNNLYGTEL